MAENCAESAITAIPQTTSTVSRTANELPLSNGKRAHIKPESTRAPAATFGLPYERLRYPPSVHPTKPMPITKRKALRQELLVAGLREKPKKATPPEWGRASRMRKAPTCDRSNPGLRRETLRHEKRQGRGPICVGLWPAQVLGKAHRPI